MSPPSPTLDRAAWLRARRTGIGGSDISAIMGINPYKTAYQVYLDKTGHAPEQEPTARMKRGTALEPIALAEYESRHGKTERLGLVRDTRYRYILGTPDAMHGDTVLEVKVPDRYVYKSWGGQIPPYYYAQMQWYMYLTSASKGILIAYVDGLDYHEIHVVADKAFQDEMVAAAVDWWTRYIVMMDEHPYDQPPTPTASTDTALEADSDLARVYGELVELRATKSQIEDREEALIETIKAAMGDAAVLNVGGQKAATYATVVSRRLDSKRLKAEAPDIYAKYQTESITRPFRLA